MKKKLPLILLLLLLVCIVSASIVLSGAKYVAATEIYVWKPHNEQLVAAIESDSRFNDVEIITSVGSYNIIFQCVADSRQKALDTIREVQRFSVEWGRDPEHQVHRYPADPNNPGTYIRMIEDAVKPISGIDCEYDRFYAIRL